MPRSLRLALFAALLASVAMNASAQVAVITHDLVFSSYDGHEMRGRLTMPAGPGPHPVVVYAQTAEGMTIDSRRARPDGSTFTYFSLYTDSLPAAGIAFLRYDGRGIGVGDAPPRFESIDTTAFNTSTLDNKVRDLLSAVDVARKWPGIDSTRVFLMGASEGTLLVADAASRAPGHVAGLVMYGVQAANMKETLRYIFSDGAFLNYRRAFDTDGDGVVSEAEYEADPLRFRERALRNAPFSAMDVNRDGVLSVDDITTSTAPLLAALDSNNFMLLHLWAKMNAAVAVPAGWFADHFAYPEMWSFLSRLDMPVGLFHGDMDTMTPESAVRRMELRATAEGKSNMRFHYFDQLDHSLGLGAYFARGVFPAGHSAIFTWLREHAGTR